MVGGVCSPFAVADFSSLLALKSPFFAALGLSRLFCMQPVETHSHPTENSSAQTRTASLFSLLFFLVVLFLVRSLVCPRFFFSVAFLSSRFNATTVLVAPLFPFLASLAHPAPSFGIASSPSLLSSVALSLHPSPLASSPRSSPLLPSHPSPPSSRLRLPASSSLSSAFRRSPRGCPSAVRLCRLYAHREGSSRGSPVSAFGASQPRSLACTMASAVLLRRLGFVGSPSASVASLQGDLAARHTTQRLLSLAFARRVNSPRSPYQAKRLFSSSSLFSPSSSSSLFSSTLASRCRSACQSSSPPSFLADRRRLSSSLSASLSSLSSLSPALRPSNGGDPASPRRSSPASLSRSAAFSSASFPVPSQLEGDVLSEPPSGVCTPDGVLGEGAFAQHAAPGVADALFHGEMPSPASLSFLFNSVVKVYSDFTDPNYSLPWQMQRQGTSTGSGFVLRDRLIMTNAHCVSWNNRLQVRKHGSPNKFVARIVAVGHECDLALITVDDEAFWQGDLAQLEFGDVPALQDAVVVLGYPRGGDNLCITSGVVSRVDVNPYAHSNTCLLCVQIDAAINPGNSGGPALKDGRVVGVAFQGFDNAQNIGYIVPTTVIKHFLDDVKRHKGVYTGFPSAGIVFQHLENKSMQAFLGLDKIQPRQLPPGVEASGILVTMADELRARQFARHLEGGAQSAGKREDGERGDSTETNQAGKKKEEPASDSDEDVRLKDGTRVGLKKNDVILAIDGVDVANDGTVFFREMERVNVSHTISSKFIGDTLRATVLRKKEVVDVLVPLIEENALVPKHQWDKKARYLIYGGLVFCPLTLEYLKDEFGTKFSERAPASLLQPLADIFAKEEGEEPVILSHILASDLTSGYTFRNCLLTHVDGQKVLNMKHLASLLGLPLPASSPSSAPSSVSSSPAESSEKKENDFVIFLLENKVQLVLERSKAESMQPFILKQHAIHSPTSEVL
ncbi:serine protease [Toxoplasma gondii ARI]|uniref:Serine protease n=2 Tax=Toxoplasma gondii TaxID=5811 RepID=A0A139Y1V1_TOXGO|nr:serine protease [Toxoplasma gondii ARI]